MEYKVYPNATPEIRMFKKADGTMEMQVRYVNKPMNYVGKWMPMPVEKENDNINSTKT
jgi:hypothetical protein